MTSTSHSVLLRARPTRFQCIVVVGWLAVASAASAESPRVEVKNERRWGAVLDVAYLFGGLDGFVQTPAGGQPGSTSLERPTLGEIGITSASAALVELGVEVARIQFRLGARFLRQAGDAVLTEDLVTQGRSFPAGSPVHSDLVLDWYRLAVQYEFRFFEDGSTRWLFLAPGADMTILNFGYALASPGLSSADRQYLQIGTRIGATVGARLGERFTIEATGWGGLPAGRLVQIHSFEVAGSWRVAALSSGPSLALKLGLAMDFVRFEDSQTVPNIIRIDYGPAVTIGARIAY